MISKTPEDYQYYQDRLKYLRDEEAKLADAKQEGREEGRVEGRVEGLEEGRLEGRVEGLEDGILAGKIQLLQELLGLRVTPNDELLATGTSEMVKQLTELQQRLRDRPV